MAEYTVANLREVEDRAPRFGSAPNLEARFATSPLELRNSGISYQRLAPNFRIPFGHRQTEQEEVYVLVGGSGRVKLDDEVVEVRQWDAVRVPKETTRNFEAGPDGLELLAVGARHEGDGEVVTGWWTD